MTYLYNLTLAKGLQKESHKFKRDASSMDLATDFLHAVTFSHSDFRVTDFHITELDSSATPDSTAPLIDAYRFVFPDESPLISATATHETA